MRNGLYKNGGFLCVKRLWTGTETNVQLYLVSTAIHYSILKKGFLKAKPALSKSKNSPQNLGYDATKAFKYYSEFLVLKNGQKSRHLYQQISSGNWGSSGRVSYLQDCKHVTLLLCRESFSRKYQWAIRCQSHLTVLDKTLVHPL